MLLVACDGDGPGKPPEGAFEATITAGEPSTIVVVSWTTEEPGTSKVEFGTSGAYGQVTPRGDELTTEHKVMVVGMPASTSCFLRPYSETADGERLIGPALTYETGSPPPAIALVYPDLVQADSTAPPILFTTVSTSSGVVIVNNQGQLLWWYAQPSTATGTQAYLSPDGLYVVFDSADSEHIDAEKSAITRVRLDGGDTIVTYVPGGHHDFWELPTGGYAYVMADIRETDYGSDGTLDRVVGDAIVEVDLAGTLLRNVWSTWDWIPLREAESSPFYPGALDWTHVNGIYADDEHYYVSSHNLNAIIAVRRDTGETAWQLGGDDSDFEFVGEAEQFVHQHSPRVSDGDVYLFNNTDGTGVPPSSYAVQLRPDMSAMTVDEVRRYAGDGESYSYVLGNLDVGPAGDWLVNWGTVGMIEDVAPDGTVATRFTTSIGFPVGNAHYAPDMGGPVP